jgi:hypothetical protein
VLSTPNNACWIVVIDGFTDFPLFEAVRSTKAGPILRFFDEMFNMVGVTQRVLCDKGSCFTSKHVNENCNAMDIKVSYNATATPRTNDQAERFGCVEGSASRRLVKRILQICCWLMPYSAVGCCRTMLLAVAVFWCWLNAVLCWWLFAAQYWWLYCFYVIPSLGEDVTILFLRDSVPWWTCVLKWTCVPWWTCVCP